MSTQKTFGSQLRELREEKGWTREYLAERADIAGSQLSRYERGEALPNYRPLISLARALDVALDELCCMDQV
ncbi:MULTISPECIES: helix-turn-helix domain-containing protein [Burkholderia]|uniref:helix-turn-helix domain-containing protein n=1 Tax=Burkholderia TaxID=32008 RepID=UPI000C00FA66|nr:helix-turn-helix transcriptional regulator [Burkholderia sp. JKS000303]PFH12912.1 helix-turn-helix protein [Burkholderia sp. JKS000303]